MIVKYGALNCSKIVRNALQLALTNFDHLSHASDIIPGESPALPVNFHPLVDAYFVDLAMQYLVWLAMPIVIITLFQRCRQS